MAGFSALPQEQYSRLGYHRFKDGKTESRLDEEKETLCCCEFINSKGERSHLLSLFCDCSEVDDAVDRLCRRMPVPPSKWAEVIDAVEDRIRIPWKGGARKIALDTALPCLIVPLSLWVCSWGTVWLLVVDGIAMPALLYAVWRIWLREGARPRTKFFISWSLCTTISLFCVYQTQLVGMSLCYLPRIVTPWENLSLISFLLGALYSCYVVKVRAELIANASNNNNLYPYGWKQNTVCWKDRYCRICQKNVPGKIHHCVWIDACISRVNIFPFILFLICLFFLLLHAGLIFLTSACGSIRPFFIGFGGDYSFFSAAAVIYPTSCWSFNPHFEGNVGLTFAAGVHCLCFALPVFLLLCNKLYTLGCLFCHPSACIALAHSFPFNILAYFVRKVPLLQTKGHEKECRKQDERTLIVA